MHQAPPHTPRAMFGLDRLMARPQSPPNSTPRAPTLSTKVVCLLSGGGGGLRLGHCDRSSRLRSRGGDRLDFLKELCQPLVRRTEIAIEICDATPEAKQRHLRALDVHDFTQAVVEREPAHRHTIDCHQLVASLQAALYRRRTPFRQRGDEHTPSRRVVLLKHHSHRLGERHRLVVLLRHRIHELRLLLGRRHLPLRGDAHPPVKRRLAVLIDRLGLSVRVERLL
mmetsp:Transcript_1839/g.2866  ORF Transcript_1839/g.2866 Transcript_1839/m.2866 type:complete len:225 (+) Transcript_1839:32-706(+)